MHDRAGNPAHFAFLALQTESRKLFRRCGREVAAAIPAGLDRVEMEEAVIEAVEVHPILEIVDEDDAIVYAAAEPEHEDRALRNTPFDDDRVGMELANLNVAPRILGSCILEGYTWDALKGASSE